MKKEFQKEFYKEASKFFVDIAKLIFAGVFLAGIMNNDKGKIAIMIGGISVFFLLLVSAYLMLKMSKE